MPKGGKLFDTNLKVSLEDYKIIEDAGNGFDVNAEIKLKQYRDYQTKTIALTINQASTPSQKTSNGGASSSGVIKVGDTVKVKTGAKYYYGQTVPSWVYSGTYKVYKVGVTGLSDYVVVDKTGINSPFHAADLTVITTITASSASTRSASSAPTYKTYTIKSGDTLLGIAKSRFGNGSKYIEIYNLNKTVIENAAKAHGFASSSNGNRIWAGTILQMPN
ncbi:hypothetical protein SDC9_106631 [bioreactor metagenome]|uniref:LysM domain-containing protein n=1 Tax=bioreactor metagenome TaxID=1076179 RepID=A0A645B2Y9_9ZZZZ